MRLNRQSSSTTPFPRCVLACPITLQYESIRRRCIDLAFEEIIAFLEGNGQIAIFDGSNLTKSRRDQINSLIKDHVRGGEGVDTQPLINPPIWIEMRVKSDEIMMKRFDKHKQQSLEYLGYDMEKAKREHFKRIMFQRAQ